MALLAGFAWLLTLSPAGEAGRAYAAYGGVYITASVAWLWAFEGTRRIGGTSSAPGWRCSGRP